MMTNQEHILKTACKLGRNILENGGEIYRVEESINYFLEAYGVFDAQILAIPSTIIVTIIINDKPVTMIERVKNITQNLDKLSKFNDLSRKCCRDTPPLDEVVKKMDEIKKESGYKFITLLLAYGFAGMFFCLFWKGDLRDGIVAFICGLSTKYCVDYMSKRKANIFFLNAVSSAVIGYIAIGFVNFGFAENYDKIIIGAIMSLVPGVPLTNVMRDIIAGDIITGTAKLSQVLLIATAIAVGIAIALSTSMILGVNI